MVDPYLESNSCSNGWLQRGSYCYRPYHGLYTWLNAEIYCQQQGGHLVTPSDLDEYDYVKRIFRWAQRAVTVFWIGLNDIEEEGTWKDAEGNDAVYTNWKSGEPNGGISENGVLMYVFSSDEYIDSTVQTGQHFFCKEAIGAGAIAQPTTHPLCDSSDWAWDDHSCYFFGTNTKSWSDAQDYCQDLGGDLVTIETEREFNFLVDHYRYRYSNKGFWIGLKYMSDGTYRWETEISEYPSDGSQWDSGKPDGAASGQHCVEFSAAQSYNDEDCSTALYYICEKDTLPTSYPPSFSLDVRGPTAILLSWSALPQAQQNSDITGYYIHYWPRNKQNTNNVTIDVTGLSTYTYHLTGIAADTTFEFIIQAYTEQGVGLETDPPINGTTEVAFVRNSESRKANFILKKNYRLKNHALYELEAYTLSECTNHCLKDAGCISVNYHKLSRAPRKLCVLNRASHTTNEDDLVADRDYMYGSIDGL
eukprot:XP_011678947.1 PREDICTED: C-type mannose receptor 2 [Strongylocentrotus purpuratus]